MNGCIWRVANDYWVSVHPIQHNLHPILDSLSGWPLPTPSEYWVSVHLIRHPLHPILDSLSGWLCRLYTKWIFSKGLHNLTPPASHIGWASGWLSTPSEYLISIHLIRHHLHPILDMMSGWLVPTTSEYWVSVHLIQHHLPILDTFSGWLGLWHTKWILGKCPPNLTPPSSNIG